MVILLPSRDDSFFDEVLQMCFAASKLQSVKEILYTIVSGRDPIVIGIFLLNFQSILSFEQIR